MNVVQQAREASARYGVITSGVLVKDEWAIGRVNDGTLLLECWDYAHRPKSGAED